MREDLNHNDFADDVSGAKKGVDIHNEVKKKIHKMPIENIDSMGQRLLQRYINKGRFPPPPKKKIIMGGVFFKLLNWWSNLKNNLKKVIHEGRGQDP